MVFVCSVCRCSLGCSSVWFILMRNVSIFSVISMLVDRGVLLVWMVVSVSVLYVMNLFCGMKIMCVMENISMSVSVSSV